MERAGCATVAPRPQGSHEESTSPRRGLRHDIEAMGWTVAECARRLGLSRAALSRVLNGRQRITPAIALSLERLGWSDAETWMRLQATYDLAQEALVSEAVLG